MINNTHLSNATIKDYLKVAGIRPELIKEVTMDGWTLKVSYDAGVDFENFKDVQESGRGKEPERKAAFHTKNRRD